MTTKSRKQLTAGEVKQIREGHEEGCDVADLARKYKAGYSSVSSIISNLTFKWVTKDTPDHLKHAPKSDDTMHAELLRRRARNKEVNDRIKENIEKKGISAVEAREWADGKTFPDRIVVLIRQLSDDYNWGCSDISRFIRAPRERVFLVIHRLSYKDVK